MALQQSTVGIALQVLGSFDQMLAISKEFFTGTHQRIPALSKFRFQKILRTVSTRNPDPDFAVLCLCILLVQQMPAEMNSIRSQLYVTVKNMISTLEMGHYLSLDLLHCRILITFYEMGHGRHTAAYLSVAACARMARVLGLHRKAWRNMSAGSDRLALEEEKRTWWAMAIMDRFICLCNGDALFVTDDPERIDPLPIEDLLWSEGSGSEELEHFIATPPTLDTPVNVTVGQMAREGQISHLVGRVVRHVFSPTLDPDFNREEGIQLERTLKAYLPLLAQEELRIGKYCAAFGMCNRFVSSSYLSVHSQSDNHSALFILYEFMLNHSNESAAGRQRILQSMEETSHGALMFSRASYLDRCENYPAEVLSPYLPYSLCQAAGIQYRLWKHTNDPKYKEHIETFKDIMGEFTRRWVVASESSTGSVCLCYPSTNAVTDEYLTIIKNFDQSWPFIAVPFQRGFLSTGKPVT